MPIFNWLLSTILIPNTQGRRDGSVKRVRIKIMASKEHKI